MNILGKFRKKGSQWDDMLNNVDYKDLQKRIANYFYSLKTDAESKGMVCYFKKEILNAGTKFVENPCYASAVKLMEADPKLIPEVLTMKSINEISKAIITASLVGSECVKPLIKLSDEEKKFAEVYVIYEFLYFFVHIAMRSAVSLLTSEQIKKLQDLLGPVIVATTVNTFFQHEYKEMMTKMERQFYENMNNAHVEYSSLDDLSTSSSLLIKLGENVAEQCGDPMNKTIPLMIGTSTVNSLKEIDFDRLIVEAKKVL